jgi:hypothetical protein
MADQHPLTGGSSVTAPSIQQVQQQLLDIVEDERFEGFWIEYGVVEHVYAHRHRSDFIALLNGRRHAFNGEGDQSRTVSHVLSNGAMSPMAHEQPQRIRLRTDVPSTGSWRRWRPRISWWASVTIDEPPWDPQHMLSCNEFYMAYVPSPPGQHISWRII